MVPNPGDAADPWRGLLSSFGFDKTYYGSNGSGIRTNKGYLLIPVNARSGALAKPISTAIVDEITAAGNTGCAQGVVVVTPDGESAFYYDFVCVQYRKCYIDSTALVAWGMSATQDLPPEDPDSSGMFQVVETKNYQLASIHDRYGNRVEFEDVKTDVDNHTGFSLFNGFKATAYVNDLANGWVRVNRDGVTYGTGESFILRNTSGSDFGSTPGVIPVTPMVMYRSRVDPLLTAHGLFYSEISDFRDEIEFPDGNVIDLFSGYPTDAVTEDLKGYYSYVSYYKDITVYPPTYTPMIKALENGVDFAHSQVFRPAGWWEHTYYKALVPLECKLNLLSRIKLPGKELVFSWKPYVLPDYTGTYFQSHLWGVVSVQETDLKTGDVRTTTYDRTFPAWSGVNKWSSNILKVTTTLPDGKTVYTETGINTCPGGDTDPISFSASLSVASQPLLLEETRASNGGRLISRKSYSGFTHRTDSGWNSVVPQATQIVSSDFDLGTVTVEEKSSYDSVKGTWLVDTTTVRAGSAPMGLYSYVTDIPVVFQRQTTRDLDTDPVRYLMMREKSRVTQRLVDLMGTFAGTFSGPTEEDNVQRTFLPGFNSILTETHQGLLLAQRTYAGTSGMDAAHPDSIRLVWKGADTANLSGAVGAGYGYDDNGYMSTISPKGVSWTLGQKVGDYGRPASQTDANGNTTNFTWDSMGRVTDVKPALPQAPTHIEYPDAQTAKVQVTMGSTVQETVYKYTGFGQLLSIDRPGGGRKTFTYDANTGDMLTESVWAAQGAQAAVTQYAYDDRGRVIRMTDPNAIATITSTTYNGRTRTVQVGTGTTAPVTILENDALGQLKSVKSLSGPGGSVVTQCAYTYDIHGRLASAIQSVGSNCQTRTWTYNALGWLTSRTDPETETTTFQDFDVNGHPWTTNLLGLDGTSTLVLKATYDALSRPLTITGGEAGGLVDEAFGYDDAGAGAAVHGNGKRVWDRSGTVSRTLSYSAGQGLLANLTTTLPNVDSPFVQTFNYDALGNRTSAVLDGRPVLYSYDPSTNLPANVKYIVGALVTPHFNPLDWTLTDLTWSNGVVSSFGYDGDQSRLLTMAHTFPTTPSGWTPLQTTWNLNYDDSGRLLTDGQDAYDYDGLNRLTKATLLWKSDPTSSQIQTLTQMFQYDGFGNMIKGTSLNVAGNPLNYPSTIAMNFTFKPDEQQLLLTNNRLPRDSVAGPLYDNQGNLLQVNMVPGGNPNNNARIMTYDALGRVTTLFDARSSSNVTEKYFYDADGLRMIIEEWQAGVLVRRRINIYNDLRQLVGQWVME